MNILILSWDSLDNEIWLGRHYLAKELSKKYAVHFIERDPTLPQVIFGKLNNYNWKRLYKQKEFSKDLFQFLPFPQFPGQRKHNIISKINQFKLLLEIKYYLKKNNIKDYIIITSIYNSSSIIKKLNARRAFYFAYDDIFSYEWSCKIDQIIKDEIATAMSCDKTFVVSEKLIEKFKKYDIDTTLVPHGIDLDFFNIDHLKGKEPPIKITELKKSQKAIIMFFGKFRTTALNKDLILQILNENKKYEFVFIGEDYDFNVNEVERTNGNFHYFGKVRFSELANYIYHSDYIFIPYGFTDYTLHNNPIKLFQIFALGTPVLTTPFNDIINSLGDFVYYFETAEQFYKQLEFIKSNDSQNNRQNRINFAKENSWNNRVQIIEELF